MSFSPELSKMPQVLYPFWKSRLMGEVLVGCLFEDHSQPRNIIADARRLVNFREMEICGVENTSLFGGSLAIINHPDIDTLIPALFFLTAEINDYCEKNVVFTMASEVSLSGKYSIPIVTKLVENFTRLYPENIIPVPTANRKNMYKDKRTNSRQIIIRKMEEGNIVVLAPEARVEKNNIILEKGTYRFGAGELAKIAAGLNIPQLPIAIWQEEKKIKIVVGSPFFVGRDLDNSEASVELMRQVAKCLPQRLRGPFEFEKG